jgi:hypothetical protein
MPLLAPPRPLATPHLDSDATRCNAAWTPQGLPRGYHELPQVRVQPADTPTGAWCNQHVCALCLKQLHVNVHCPCGSALRFIHA